MKCNNNCPAYCEETYHTGGAPIGILETYCCINFEQCLPEGGCKRTLNEVKTDMKLKELSGKFPGEVMTVNDFLSRLYKGKISLNDCFSYGEWLNKDGKIIDLIYSESGPNDNNPDNEPAFVHWNSIKQ